MKADYKNWMPKGMVTGTGCGMIASLVLFFFALFLPNLFIKHTGKAGRIYDNNLKWFFLTSIRPSFFILPSSFERALRSRLR